MIHAGAWVRILPSHREAARRHHLGGECAGKGQHLRDAPAPHLSVIYNIASYNIYS